MSHHINDELEQEPNQTNARVLAYLTTIHGWHTLAQIKKAIPGVDGSLVHNAVVDLESDGKIEHEVNGGYYTSPGYRWCITQPVTIVRPATAHQSDAEPLQATGGTPASTTAPEPAAMPTATPGAMHLTGLAVSLQQYPGLVLARGLAQHQDDDQDTPEHVEADLPADTPCLLPGGAVAPLSWVVAAAPDNASTLDQGTSTDQGAA